MRIHHVIIFFILAVITIAFDARVAVQHVLGKQRMFSQLLERNDYTLHTSITGKSDHLFSSDNIISTISQSNALKELSRDCREDLELIIKPTANFTTTLLKMIDSAGKLAPGILLGHVYFAGHFSECTEIDYVVDGRDRHFKGAYFRIDIDPKFRSNSRNDSCKPVFPFVSLVAAFWQVGVCLPATCSSAELQHLFRPNVASDSMTIEASIPNPVCNFTKPGDQTPEITSGFYITIVIMGTIVFICVLSGVVDFFFTDRLKETSLSKCMGWQLIMACSLYSNISSIFDVSEAGKSDQIGPIHCIRFFSMVWVLLAHLFGSYIAVVANPTDILYLIPDLTSEVLLNGFFSVDSFFFMSGVLLTFLWFKCYHRHPDETMSVRGWTLFYAHRFLRLSPAFYMLVIFYTFVFKQMIRDSPLSMNPLVTEDQCSSTWWVELTYLHNWVDHKEMCLGYSWYLDADMQMFLVTPLLIIPLAIKPMWGFIVAAVIFVISSGVNIFLVYYYHWPAGASIIFPPDPEMTNIENFPMLMYSNPLIRCQIYIMGMLVGRLLQRRKQLKIHPVVYLSAWVISLSLMLTVLLGLHDQTNGTYIGLFGRSMYSSLSRPAWGIGLSTIVILCYYGYGGPVNSFMSWHIWVPLGRLSYCGYLIHIPVIHYVLALTKDEVYFSSFTEFFIGRVVPVTAVTYFVAVFWSACFELSFGRIEKLLIGGVRIEKSEDQEELIQEEGEDMDEEENDEDRSIPV